MISETLIAAIRAKRHLVLQYDGYARTVEPHRYWQDEKHVNRLLCWQTAGGSKSGETAGWKSLNVMDIHSASTSGTCFAHAREGYNRDNAATHHIYAQL